LESKVEGKEGNSEEEEGAVAEEWKLKVGIENRPRAILKKKMKWKEIRIGLKNGGMSQGGLNNEKGTEDRNLIRMKGRRDIEMNQEGRHPVRNNAEEEEIEDRNQIRKEGRRDIAMNQEREEGTEDRQQIRMNGKEEEWVNHGKVGILKRNTMVDGRHSQELEWDDQLLQVEGFGK
jgi:hypothetical protein